MKTIDEFPATLRARVLFLVGAILLAVQGGSQELAGQAQEPTITDLAWLAGKWVEDRPEFDRVIEIRWEVPQGDAMVGTWRSVKDGVLLSYEMLTMRETERGIVYRYDQFDKDRGFEDPRSTEFVLDDVSDSRAVFTDSEAGDWKLILEITDEGLLRGRQENARTGETYVGYNADRRSRD